MRGRPRLTFGSSVELLAESAGHIGPKGVEDVRLSVLIAEDKRSSYRLYWKAWEGPIIKTLITKAK